MAPALLDKPAVAPAVQASAPDTTRPSASGVSTRKDDLASLQSIAHPLDSRITGRPRLPSGDTPAPAALTPAYAVCTNRMTDEPRADPKRCRRRSCDVWPAQRAKCCAEGSSLPLQVYADCIIPVRPGTERIKCMLTERSLAREAAISSNSFGDVNALCAESVAAHRQQT